MDKKIILLCGVLLVSTFSFGQKAKVREANREMDKYTEARQQNKTAEMTTAIQKAKAAIDEAVADPSTSEDAKAWFKKADIYLALQEVEGLNADNPYAEGVEAMKKAIELDPKLNNGSDAVNMRFRGGVHSFNSGVNAYNSSDFQASYGNLKTTLELLGKEKDKKFILYPSVDTIRSQARMLLAFAAYYTDKNDEAISLLKEAVGDPHLENRSNIYLVLAQAYEKKGDKTNQLNTIEEGLAKYPDDQNLKNAKFNYLIGTGEYKTLEEAVKTDPDNAELLFNLGIIYQDLGFGKDGKRPENSKAFLDKAEASYKKVLSLQPENGIFNYQLGAFYFNQAAEITKVMNNLEISENVKYEQLRKERDHFFEMALPLLEKSKSIFAASGKLSGEEKSFYAQSLQALVNIYTNQDELDKADKLNEQLKHIYE